jgi:hypothetical protein
MSLSGEVALAGRLPEETSKVLKPEADTAKYLQPLQAESFHETFFARPHS